MINKENINPKKETLILIKDYYTILYQIVNFISILDTFFFAVNHLFLSKYRINNNFY